MFHQSSIADAAIHGVQKNRAQNMAASCYQHYDNNRSFCDFPHAGSLSSILNHWYPIKVATDLLPASKGEVQRYNDAQNVIINQLVKQINALTPVSGISSAV